MTGGLNPLEKRAEEPEIGPAKREIPRADRMSPFQMRLTPRHRVSAPNYRCGPLGGCHLRFWQFLLYDPFSDPS